MNLLVMRTIIVAVLLVLAVAAHASDYCAGWNDGFIAGYCYQKVGCIEPIVPICPIPKIGEDGYQDGYNRGFLAGLSRQR